MTETTCDGKKTKSNRFCWTQASEHVWHGKRPGDEFHIEIHHDDGHYFVIGGPVGAVRTSYRSLHGAKIAAAKRC